MIDGEDVLVVLVDCVFEVFDDISNGKCTLSDAFRMSFL